MLFAVVFVLPTTAFLLKLRWDLMMLAKALGKKNQRNESDEQDCYCITRIHETSENAAHNNIYNE